MTENDKSELKKTQFSEIRDHLNHWFYKPDTDALEICLSAYVSHLNLKVDPIWLFVIGASSTGKTHIICNALNCLSGTKEVSDITPSSFVSGLKKGSGGYSLLFDLTKIGKDPGKTQGTLIFPDFSSILGMKFEDRAALMKHLRQIYDGRFNPLKGVQMAIKGGWSGKVSIIAAVTDSVERAWAVQRDLGERFIQVRWNREDGQAMALSAMNQVESSGIISKFQGMVKKFVDVETLPAKSGKLETNSLIQLAALSDMVAKLRGSIIRNSTSREIIDVPEAEGTGRLVKALANLAIAHSRLFRRTEIDQRSIDLAIRTALDSVPRNRLKIFNALGTGATLGDLVKSTKLQHSIVEYVCDELAAMNIIQAITTANVTKYELVDDFIKLRMKALGEDWNVIDFPQQGKL